MSSAVTKKGEDAVAPQSQQAGVMESEEYKASASAGAGLNLNVVGAIKGAFSSQSKKDTQPDGSSVETRDEQAHVKGAGAGNLDAAGAASAEEEGRKMRQAITENSSK